MKTRILLMLPALLLLSSCNFETNEELTVKKMLSDFINDVQHNDENHVHGILLDLASFRTLNPDVASRTDAASFTDGVLDDLVSNFRNLADYFKGKELKVTSVTLGGPWYQYKGFSAFKDTVVVVSADGEDVELIIRGIVRVNDKWRIVDLSDTGLY